MLVQPASYQIQASIELLGCRYSPAVRFVRLCSPFGIRQENDPLPTAAAGRARSASRPAAIAPFALAFIRVSFPRRSFLVAKSSRMKTNSLAFKVVVVGDSAVGKSAIVERLVQGTFREDATSTCGADFYTYVCPVDSETVRLQIWDTAGQDRFRAISKSYFRNAVGAILVYDLTSMSSFDNAAGWLHELTSLALPNAYVLLVGNKADLEDRREVGPQMVRTFSQQHRIESLETSALTGKGVAEAFARLAFAVYERVKSNQIRPAPALRAFPQEAQPGAPAANRAGCC
jgi:small GTP-binding protein